jgi:hypothetical protein
MRAGIDLFDRILRSIVAMRHVLTGSVIQPRAGVSVDSDDG